MADQQERQRRKFSDAALVEAIATAERASEAHKGRSAVRGVTIDGPASKDLDDALWLESNSRGDYRLDVSIADVGSLITPRMTPQLDKEAFKRSFTRYYAERNAPMLPRQLSEGKLSLLEGQTRPAITISIPLDAQLHAGEPYIHRTYVSSSKRFSYDEVDDEIERPQTEFAPMLQAAFRIAQGLLRSRRARGALAIYDLHAGWVTTEEGTLIQLPEGERHKAHIIIQECMILANQAVALYLAERGLPALYRNHAAKAIAPERAALLQMIETAVTHPEQVTPERVRTTVDLALERAKYAPTVEGHFGLNLPAYIHVTSPLRRYPDLVNQRILHAVLKGEPIPYTSAELKAIAVHINEEEDAMRDARKAHFLAEHDERIRRTIAEAARIQATSTRPLGNLDTKQFHSTLRMAAEAHVLSPALEQEIFMRLEEQTLQANDIFTFVFRFQNGGKAWERVKRASLQWLQRNPHHAVSILMMGQQALGWGEPEWEITAEGPGNQWIFQARAMVKIDGQQYSSSLRSATQKERVKQLASAEVLANVAGVELASTAPEAQDVTNTHVPQPVAEKATPPGIASKNAVSVLHEMTQRKEIHSATYIYEPSGPPHDLTFTCLCVITVPDGRKIESSATGKNKKEAAQDAALQALASLFTLDAGKIEN